MRNYSLQQNHPLHGQNLPMQQHFTDMSLTNRLVQNPALKIKLNECNGEVKLFDMRRSYKLLICRAI